MNKEKNQTKSETKTNYLKHANRLVILLVFASSVLYLTGTNDLAIKHFVVQENKRKLNNLKEQNMQLETRAMALSSFTTITKKVGNLKMVKVDKVDYIAVNPAVAKR